MELGQQILTARKNKGLTQEELAERTNLTARTIQRIEAGESTPRSYTLKAMAMALDIPFEKLLTVNKAIISEPAEATASYKEEDSKHFLQMLCLSCFSYLVIPFIHFLIPRNILNRSDEENPKVIAFARKVIRIQVYWQTILCLLMLATVAWNVMMALYFEKAYLLNYLWPFFFMYLLNAVIIFSSLARVQNTSFALNTTA